MNVTHRAREDYSTFSEEWHEKVEATATVLGRLGEEAALEVLRQAAAEAGGWTTEHNAIGLRLLKPDVPLSEAVSE